MNRFLKDKYYFCKFSPVSKYEDLDIKPNFLKDLILSNEKKLYKYIDKNMPFLIKDMFINDVKGIEVFLPIIKLDIEKNKDRYLDILYEVKSAIVNMDIEVFAFFDEYEESEYLPIVKYSFVEEIFDNSIKYIKEHERKILVVLCERDYYNKVAILKAASESDEVCVYGNLLSENVSEFVDYIYEETGLFISLINDEKVLLNSVKYYNFILDLSYLDLNIKHKLQENSVFVSIVNDKICKSILSVRNDVKVVQNLFVKTIENKYTLEDLSQMLFVCDKTFGLSEVDKVNFKRSLLHN